MFNKSLILPILTLCIIQNSFAGLQKDNTMNNISNIVQIFNKNNITSNDKQAQQYKQSEKILDMAKNIDKKVTNNNQQQYNQNKTINNHQLSSQHKTGNTVLNTVLSRAQIFDPINNNQKTHNKPKDEAISDKIQIFNKQEKNSNQLQYRKQNSKILSKVKLFSNKESKNQQHKLSNNTLSETHNFNKKEEFPKRYNKNMNKEQYNIRLANKLRKIQENRRNKMVPDAYYKDAKKPPIKRKQPNGEKIYYVDSKGNHHLTPRAKKEIAEQQSNIMDQSIIKKFQDIIEKINNCTNPQRITNYKNELQEVINNSISSGLSKKYITEILEGLSHNINSDKLKYLGNINNLI